MSPKASRAPLALLDLRRLPDWRRWLAAHRTTNPGVWLVFHKQHTGVEAIPYEDAVCEALCVGWIDSLVKRLDDERYARKFTPRTATSTWSPINRRRWEALKAAGRLSPAGLETAPVAGRVSGLPVVPDVLPRDIERAIRDVPAAWTAFQRLPPGRRRLYVAWILSAKREDTRARRIREITSRLADGQSLGLK